MSKDEIIKKLAEMDPMRDDNSGGTSCFFCGAFETINKHSKTIDHEIDCIWAATQQIKDN
jgi:hypothetical protein